MLKIVFMGTPEFSVPILEALIQAGHTVCAVYSQPPRPAGRGHKVQLSPVHHYAEKMGLPVYTPKNFNTQDAQDSFKQHQSDVAIVAAYGLILKKVILEAPRFGCINVHASLLPRWRGAAPIQRAIMAGDTVSGITIMQMDTGLDTGPILAKHPVALTPTTTFSSLYDQLAHVGQDLIITVLNQLECYELAPQAQLAEGVTYAHKIDRHEGWLDWHKPAQHLDHLIRALNPWPGTFFHYNQEVIKVLHAEIVDYQGSKPIGTVLDEHLTVVCQDQALRLKILQKSGKKPLLTHDFLNGTPILIDAQLSCQNPFDATV